MNLVLDKTLVNDKTYSLVQAHNGAYYICVESDHPEVDNIISSYYEYSVAIQEFKKLNRKGENS